MKILILLLVYWSILGVLFVYFSPALIQVSTNAELENLGSSQSTSPLLFYNILGFEVYAVLPVFFIVFNTFVFTLTLIVLYRVLVK